MFLKINDGNGGWILFDSVDRVDFISNKKSITDRADLKEFDLVHEGLVNLISKDCFPRNNPIDVGVITFYRNQVKTVALFASEAYVLNGFGNTIETIRANTLKGI